MQIGFRGKKAVNTVIDAKLPDGCGFLADPRLPESLLNDPEDDFRAYLRGRIHDRPASPERSESVQQ